MRDNGMYRHAVGSNHPFWPAGEYVVDLDALELGEPANAAFLAGNAQRVFRLN
ncbi:MAG TPA: hypothetical protein VN702_21940 [Acetobacteraceae bacterium]|nr:hypothetical protein [Acetobacteraceae bacterium]